MVPMNQPSRTILIVDDCPEDRELYKRYLRRDRECNYTILEAEEGQVGLELWQNHQPDVLLLDYQLPDLDGLEFLAQLSSQTTSPCLPVIMVTGYGHEGITVQAMRSGAQDYLVKGQITPDSLRRTIRDTLATVQLQTQLQQRIDRERLVAQITTQIHRSLDLHEILQTTTTLVRQFLHTDRVLIFRLQPDGWGTITTESVGTDWTSVLSTRLFDPCLNEQCLEPFRQGSFVARSDIHDGSLDPCHVQLLSPFQVQANLVVPILQNQQVWGLLVAQHCASPHQWQEIEIQLLQEVATQVGIAVQQADFYEQAQHELAQRKQTEVFLQALSQDLEGQVTERTIELVELNQNLNQHLAHLQANQAQVQELSDALSNAVEGISRLAPSGHYLTVNAAYARAVGYTSAEMIGMEWQKTVHPDDLERVTAAYQHMLEHGKVELEARGIRKDGSLFYKHLLMVSTYDEQQQFSGHFCFMNDMTERKQLEAENQQLEGQFLRTQRLESIGTLASGIAHDLNNILTPVLAVSQLLPRKLSNLDESTQHLLEILQINATRGGDLVKQVLSFARGHDGQRLPLQVGHLLVEMGKIAQQTFPKSIQIQSQVATQDLWLVHGDATQLHQVLMNLCVNARDAMPEGGTLSIAAENFLIEETFARMHLNAQVGRSIKITIADTGMGIAPNILNHIFDPFFTTKEQGKGTGLGLSTVHTIIKNHGGFLVVKTELEQGSCFEVYLPALVQREDTAIAASTDLDGNDQLILVVDDEGLIGETVKATLEAHHYRVLVASDGIDAIAYYAEHQTEIALVILDLMMPGLDGFKLVETLPKFNPKVRIIVMSGSSMCQEKVIAYSQVQAFLPKPFTAEALLNVITSALALVPSQVAV
jgi:two-component system, cell cycle sensor histidine kinase and response regulator CckA